MYSLYGQYPCRYWGFPIRKSTDHNLFAVPRGLSQPITSFFGSQWQGIHPVLFLAWPSVCFSRLFGKHRKILLLSSFVRSTYTSTPVAPKERFFPRKYAKRDFDTLYHYLGPYNYSLDLFTWIIWVSSVICSYWISIQLPAVTSSLK